MNRLILLGNGFDLAHGMKTSYNDFILWYLESCFQAATTDKPYNDPLLSISVLSQSMIFSELQGATLAQYLRMHYEANTLASLMNVQPSFSFSMTASRNRPRSVNQILKPFSVKVQSDLLVQMIRNCSISKWVDIENLFYTILKQILKGNKADPEKQKEITELNHSLAFIIDKLQVYLSDLKPPTNIDDYYALFTEDINLNEIVERKELALEFRSSANKPRRTTILNFNYTSTVEEYIQGSKIDINYIHGKLNNKENPVVFGFGDELDADYASFELDATKEIFRYIKSFWYFKTSNYHNLLRFIESDNFQVYILGHSCGLSDRTMLNMIFEHQNCVSIKVFYYVAPDDHNNFTDLTEEISRHFKDKRQMRLKIVPFDKSSPMPQSDFKFA